ncbi:FtsK/SpoIIIE domain-containing protein [Neobacillus sp. M.A.Huq-85]
MSIWAKLKTRHKLVKAFKNGGLHLTHKIDDNNERLILPKIHSVNIYDSATTITFTIPNGLDPKLIKKSEFLFKQYFGKDTTLEGELKLFKLTIVTKSKKEKVPYDYPQLLEIIKREGYFMPIVCGQDSNKQMHIYDATNNPNLLIFGQPGSGKSSILHVILTTLIQLYSEDEINFYIADFKQSELAVYEGVQHVKSVSYQVKDFAPVLTHLKKELIKRGELLKNHRVRHVNKLPADKKPPFIVLCVDEFVMINDADIMADLLQIASLGRAYGIYLILSMQRPSHKILSTDVRGVLSVRMGFRTVDKRNAMIGETPGSEKISKDEPGKFLLNLDELTELRAPYLDEEKTEEILAKYKSDDWTNHNYRKVATSPPNEEPNDATSQHLTESEVFYDAIKQP